MVRGLIYTSYNSELKQIEFGNYYGAAVVTVDGQDRLYTWGDNFYGQLGIGDSSIQYADTPRLVYVAPEGTTIEQIETGDFYMGMLTNDGTNQHLYTWGENVFNELGYDTTGKNVYSPTEIDLSAFSGTETTDITFGKATSFLISEDDTYQYLYGWGYNGWGQLGNDDISSAAEPALLLKIPLSSYKITDVDQNLYASYMVVDGVNGTSTLYGTGDASSGQMGLDPDLYTVVYHWIPIYATSESTISEVSTSGNNVSFIVDSNEQQKSTLYSLGYNAQGQLGNGNYSDAYQIQTTISTTNQLSQLDLKYRTATVIESDANNSSYLGWGSNYYGQLGLGTESQTSYNTSQTLFTLDNSIQSVSQKTVSNYNTSYVIENYNTVNEGSYQQVYVAGENNYGQFGNGTVDSTIDTEQTPTLVAIIIPTSNLELQKSNRSLIINEQTSNTNSFQYTFEFIEIENGFYL